MYTTRFLNVITLKIHVVKLCMCSVVGATASVVQLVSIYVCTYTQLCGNKNASQHLSLKRDSVDALTVMEEFAYTNIMNH